jgi:hypothetical protein
MATLSFRSAVMEVEKIFYAPFHAEALTFLLGAFVVMLLLDTLSYWKSSSNDCQIGGTLCQDTIATFSTINRLLLAIFGYAIYVKLIAAGVKREGFHVRAFLPAFSFYVIVKLLIWLFKDVFKVMQTTLTGDQNDFAGILRYEFWRDLTYLAPTEADFASVSYFPVILGVLLGMS